MKKERIIEEEGDGPTRTFFALLPLRLLPAADADDGFAERRLDRPADFCLKVDGDDDDDATAVAAGGVLSCFFFLARRDDDGFRPPPYIYFVKQNGFLELALAVCCSDGAAHGFVLFSGFL